MMKKIIPLLLLFTGLIANVHAATIINDNFDGYADKAAVDVVWGSIGSNVTLETGAEAYGGTGKCMKWTYSSSGTPPFEFTRSILSASVADVYVQFRFKIVRLGQAEPRGAVKFCKIFGVSNEANYANSTLNLGSVTDTYPTIHGISYGNGDGVSNDTQNEVYIASGTHYDQDPLVVYTTQTSVFTPTEGQWHQLEVRFKYNTNGNRDGEYSIWIDGILRMRATNVKNRHDSNTAQWSYLSFGDYGNQYVDMLLYIDDVVVSDTFIGGTPDPDTTPPTVTISTSDPQNVSTDSVSISWTDSDNVGVTGRKWRIGSAPDASNGTPCTSPATITGLSVGSNTVYIGAGDAAGNWGSDSITVNYRPVATTISIINSGIRGGGGVR